MISPETSKLIFADWRPGLQTYYAGTPDTDLRSAEHRDDHTSKEIADTFYL